MRVENRDIARALAMELREHTGSHAWRDLCNLVMNLSDDVETLLSGQGITGELMSELHKRYVTGPIDLRFTNGRWCVMLPVGNQMMVADASFADTPEQALRNTIAAWDARSTDKPFGWSAD